MTRIRRRLTLHFMYQFVFHWLFILVLLCVGLILIIRYVSNEELKKNFTAGALDSIVLEADLTGSSPVLPQWWTEQLTERGHWLQIIDREGKVVYAVNTPQALKKAYRATELVDIKQSGRIAAYRVFLKLEPPDKQTHLFMLGVEDTGSEKLQGWFQTYSSAGLIRSDALGELETLLKQSGEFIQVVDPAGQIVQVAGPSPRSEPYRPLELISMQEEPDSFTSKSYMHVDEATGHVWMLHAVQNDAPSGGQPILHHFMIALSVTAGFALLLTLGFSVWHGYRYGQPLLLFAAWFDRMGMGGHPEALTEKDRNRVYRKNGSIRLRYRLYKEVIAGFNHMAERLDTAERERARLERTREEWMTGISHDLRTPLSTIQGYGHLLESDSYEWTGEELKGMGKMIREKGDYMLELLQDFSLTFQLQNRDVPFSLTRTELNEFTRRVVLRYVNDATLQQVSFRFESHQTDLFINLNPMWFQRMLDNLITNAIKHNPPGVHIVVQTRVQAGHGAIVVEDDGAGMDEETRRNLFERYYRGTPTEEEANGTGLGMNIARSIVLAHQGSIDVESRKNEGTRITVLLPLALPE
ncbi:HAMP domain-containing sensor histidine kinase [Paenibacillus filicis]|uniref:histidine kinase n=1 Tax=Paenibacillus filicis TaxID=669464 RepID=A0ABU9DG46_9BACL